MFGIWGGKGLGLEGTHLYAKNIEQIYKIMAQWNNLQNKATKTANKYIHDI